MHTTSCKRLKSLRENDFGVDSMEPSTSRSSNSQQNNTLNAGFSSETYRLAKTLNEVIDDPMSLSYFINFLESIGQLNFIKFWLHVKGFQLSPTKTDAENIFECYLSNASILGLPPEVIHNVKEILFNSTFSIEFNLFTEAQAFVWKSIEHRFFKRFLHSVFYAKYKLEVFQSDQLNLADVLRSHGLLSSFVEFLEDNGCRNLLEFMIAVDSFVTELSDNECRNAGKMGMSHQEDAMLIYDRFISMQATDPIGVDDDIRIAVESGICTENGVPKANSFDLAKDFALQTLQKKHMPAFLKSENFARLVNEAHKNMDTLMRMSSQHTEIYQHSNKSFLASHSSVESRRSSSQLHNHSQTCNSDGSWQPDSKEDVNSYSESSGRRKQKCSSLAEIDKFGRYTPLFDNTLISDAEIAQLSSRTRLKNTLDKYLNQTAMKESVAADEMAELLISEIRNMVLSANSQRN